jgi:hypothetical protein
MALPHEPVSRGWRLADGQQAVHPLPWGPHSFSACHPKSLQGDSMLVRLANGQLVIVTAKVANPQEA